VAFLIIVVAVLALILIRFAIASRSGRRRRILRSRPFPAEWKAILEKDSSLYRALPSTLKKDLHGLIHIFLDEKRFEGCQGLEVTEDMKLVIACQACLLLVNKQAN